MTNNYELAKTKHPIDKYNDPMKYAKQLGFGELYTKIDISTGLYAIIAIHSTKLGPTLGGCRLAEYSSFNEAMYDALRLARGMSYKAAMAGLALGGGKSVLLKPKQIGDKNAYFESFGSFVEQFDGRYITAIDSGTSVEDMDIVARKTKYVTCTSDDSNNDPSPHTARGVYRSIKAAVKYKLGKDNLKGLHVAIQGVGHVGYNLAKALHEQGAILTVSDVNDDAIQHAIDEFQANVVNPEEIYAVECDVFSPCAMGAIINDQTLPLIKAKTIVGAANNQLATSWHGEQLMKKGILYAPDHVVSAGGLIAAGAQYFKDPIEKVHSQINNLYYTIMEIFERAEKENLPTNIIADIIAEERLT